MNLFFDTFVLVAASVYGHIHNARALDAIQQVNVNGNQGWMSQHGIAEFYAVLTPMPISPRIHPSEAVRILEENIFPHCRAVVLDPKDYLETIQKLAARGWSGGKIFDGLHLRCGQKAGADRVYTFNVRHFEQLAPEWEMKICAP